MRVRSGERGEGRVGLVVALAVLGIAIFAAVKYIPVKIVAFEFRDYLEKECRTAALHKNDEVIEKRILEKAAELEIPLEAKNLRVHRTNSEMVVSATYVQPIDFKIVNYDYRFEHKYKAPLF